MAAPAGEESPWTVARSRSFGAAAQQRPGAGTLGSDCSANSDLSRFSWQGSDVLGQGVRSPRESRRSLALAAGVKVPKQPRYQRALAMTEALLRGVRESIAVEQSEAQLLRDTLEAASLQSAQSQGRLYEAERRLRFTERYVKRLECHLADIEELSEQYGKQQRLREATERLAAAYSSSVGSQSQRGLSQARSGFKECTEEMCIMEAQIENKMGTLLFELKGIQGFARLCVGDVYEISVRLGSQEWRARGTVGKDQVQRWSRPKRILRPTLSDHLLIKASEVKTLGKQLLGTKVCETADLLSAETQQMIIYLNNTGSLRLTLIVTWSAIEAFPEETLARHNSTASSPGLRRQPTIASSPRPTPEERRAAHLYSGGADPLLPNTTVSSPALSVASSASSRLDSTPDILRRLGALTTESGSSQRDSCSSADSVEAALLEVAADTAAYTLQKRPEMRSDWFATAERRGRGRKQPQPEPQTPAADPAVVSGSDSAAPRLWVTGGRLRAACAAVASRLCDPSAPPAPELRAAVARLAARRRRWSLGSDVSVESALDRFSFLQSEDGECKPDLLEPGMTARTSDSGISSIVHQLSGAEDTAEEPELSDSGSGAELAAEEAAQTQRDVCLELHLRYCLRLLQGAAAAGPLRHTADRCRQRLSRQAALLELALSAAPPEELLSDPEMQEVWQEVCEGQMRYHLPAGAACDALTSLLKPRLEYKDASTASKVSRLLIGRCLDVTEFASSQQLTVFAFRDFTLDTRFNRILEELAEEAELTDTLLSHSADSIGRRLQQLVYMFPPRPCLRVLCQLLATAGQRVADTVESWLRDVARAECLTDQLTEAFFELLESESPLEREGAARSLQLLGSWAGQLQLLQQLASREPEPRVRAVLEHALTELGAEGRAALQLAMRTRSESESEHP